MLTSRDKQFVKSISKTGSFDKARGSGDREKSLLPGPFCVFTSGDGSHPGRQDRYEYGLGSGIDRIPNRRQTGEGRASLCRCYGIGNMGRLLGRGIMHAVPLTASYGATACSLNIMYLLVIIFKF